ncbi:MAG: hypothetical protein ACMUJM_04045 [bacterium]
MGSFSSLSDLGLKLHEMTGLALDVFEGWGSFPNYQKVQGFCREKREKQ